MEEIEMTEANMTGTYPNHSQRPPDVTPMQKAVENLQRRWPDIPIRTLLWVVPEQRDEFVARVRAGWLMVDKAAKAVNMDPSHFRIRAAKDQKHFPNTIIFKATGNHGSGMCLYHPEDVASFAAYYKRPQGLLTLSEAAKFTGLPEHVLRRGLGQGEGQRLAVSAVVDGHVKLFSKENLRAFRNGVVYQPRPDRGKITKPVTSKPVAPKAPVAKAAPKPTPKAKPATKLALDGGRLTYVNAFGQMKEAKTTIRVQKDRGILIVVDANECDVDAETRSAIREALNRKVVVMYDHDDLLTWFNQ